MDILCYWQDKYVVNKLGWIARVLGMTGPFVLLEFVSGPNDGMHGQCLPSALGEVWREYDF